MNKKSYKTLLWLSVAFSVLGQDSGVPALAPIAHATTVTVAGGSTNVPDHFLASRILENNLVMFRRNTGNTGRVNISDSLSGIESGRELPRNATDNMVLGGSDLIELVSGDSASEFSKFEAEFNFDPEKFTNWQNFWADFSIAPEIDELFDFTAIAVASFIPEIRFWLEGNRWAYFGSSLNGFKVVTGFDYGSDKRNPVGSVQAATHSGASGHSSGTGQTGTSTHADAPTRSLSEFLSDMFFKLVKLPITYVILFIGLVAFLINLNRQSRY